MQEVYFIKDVKHSIRVQEYLFSRGFAWGAEGKTPYMTDKQVLHATPEDMSITWSTVSYSNSKLQNNPEEYVRKELQEEFGGGANPKAMIGSKALPLTAVSPFIALYGSLGKINGANKYGVSNFIGTQVLMSIYMDAIQRHFDKIRAGEEVDAVDGVPHWGAIIANIDIILSAKHAGTLIDDRPLINTEGYQKAIADLTPLVASLQELHKDKDPKHYYLKDAV